MQFVEKRASSDNYIVLAMVDASFVEMAINLYEASFQPNKIENFLFVGVGLEACQVLWDASVPCFHYTDTGNENAPSVYGSLDFIRKTNTRAYMILEALGAGFTVVLLDVDIFLFANPLPDLKVAIDY